MKKSIAIVQTSAVSSAELKALCEEIMPEVTVYQIIDDSLIKEVNANGGPTYGVKRRMYNYYQQAESLGVDAILNQCSSVGEVADAIKPFVSVPVVKVDEAMAEKADALCQVKLGDDLLSIFVLAIFCNVMIFIGVDGYKRIPHELGKYLALFFGVVVFIICGFEHCVANMFYFSVAGAWSAKTFGYLIVMTLGNAVGGVIFPLLRMWKEKK